MSRINVPPDLLPRVFDSAVKKALEKTADLLSNEFDKEIDKSKWPWERGTTVRKARPPVGSPSDIVDTSDLKNSKKQEIIDPYSVKWTWES